ncbi:MAG: 1-acyl-sn-glycerol-3-phosphate acyltransferase [Chloroflexota bacterium]
MADENNNPRLDAFAESEPLPPVYTQPEALDLSGGDTTVDAAELADSKEAASGADGSPQDPSGDDSAAFDPTAGYPAEVEAPDEQLRGRLMAELDRLIERLRLAQPDYAPPPFSPQGVVDLVERNLDRFSPEMALTVIERLRSSIGQDLFDADTWKGIWYMVNYSLDYQKDMLKRRLSGEYETDEWGYDPEVLQLMLPFMNFMYKVYWRAEVTGVENIPEAGRALLVCNHSGQLPWDGAMVGTAVMNEHPAQRLVRTLYATWFPTLPFLSALFTKLGQVLANEENGVRLLEQDELVAVFPEGYKGVGKLFKERYRLARFGRGGFVRMALKTGAPMIPVSVVGAEETYISLTKLDFMAKAISFPYFPISPTFPWLGLLGFVPLPTKWYIDFGEPIATDTYGPGAANNLMLVSQLTDQTRNIVQNMIYSRLSQRKSIFLG